MCFDRTLFIFGFNYPLSINKVNHRIMCNYGYHDIIYFRTCRYFHYFITDPIFWRYIDARRNPNTSEKVQYCSDRIHEKTTHVLLRAKDKTCGLVPYNFFTFINPFKNIKVLALENQRFHGSRVRIYEKFFLIILPLNKTIFFSLC